MVSFKKNILLIISVLFFCLQFVTVNAADREIIPSPDPSCDQYFDHGYIYAGRGGTHLTDTIKNTRSQDPFMTFLEDEVAPTRELYRANIMDFQEPTFSHPSSFFGKCGNAWCTSSSGKSYVGVGAGETASWWKTDQYLGVTKVYTDRINPSEFAAIREKMFIIRYTLKGYYLNNGNLSPAFNGGTHTECQQVGVHWCGDGVVDSAEGETCDDGADNGKPGKCSKTCDGTVPQAPVCGNGIVETGETCDDGADNGKPGKCSTTCDKKVPEDPVCGNNVLEDGEQCEPGLASSIPAGKTCDASCKLKDKPSETPKCDTLTVSRTNITAGESVDVSCSTMPTGKSTNISCGGGTGGGNGPTTCTYNAAGTYTLKCTLQDDFSPSISCDATVTVTGETTRTYCGDGEVQTPNDDGINEQCDPNNSSSIPAGKTCNASCELEDEDTGPKTYCGDGIVQNPSKNNPNGNGTQEIYEQCEPNNPNSFDANTEICTSSCKKEPKPTGEYIDLALKKYIESNDAQTASQGPKHKKGDTFNYIIKVRNKGTKMVTSTTTVQDTLPSGVEFNGNPTGSNWSCTKSGKSITCTTGQDIAGGAEFTEIRVPVKVTATSGTVTNHATVYNPDEDKTKSCLPNNQKPSVTATSCSQDGDNEDPAVFTVSDEQYIDLALKKYIESNDAQTASQGPKHKKGDTFNYIIKVRNKGTKMVTSTTTVQDTLPSGVEFNGNPTGSSWSCTTSGKSITCTTGQDIAGGAYFTEIRVPVKVTATSGTVTNHATVYNPDEDPKKSCLPNNQKPSVTATSCSQDGYNEDPAVFTVDDTAGISIKKYAEDKNGNKKDGQNGNDALELDPGEEFYYRYEIKATGNNTKATITDTFPHQVEILGFDMNGWNCKRGTKTIDGNTHPTAICTRSTLPAGNYTVRVRVKLKESTDTSAKLRNIAYVCSDETGPYTHSNGKKSCDPECTDPNDPTCLPDKPEGGGCSTIPTDPNYDPACIKPKTGINLRIKKYINSHDAQTAINKDEDATFDYVIKVENIGTKTVTGKTTVQDTLPSGVEKDGSITGTDWSCTTSGNKITCTTLREVAKNSFFPEIRIPVEVTATAGTTVRNYATVYNPNEDDNGCYSNNQMPSGNETSCPNDDDNIDPAVFKVPSPTDGMYVAAKCLTTTSKVCVSYSSHSACENDSERTEPCREANTAGYNQCNTTDRHNDVDVDCGGTEWEPDCNNGIIDQDWEECDTGGDTTWCVQCKLVTPDPVTNPGANPLEFWLTIPDLTKGRVGYNHAISTPFNKHAVVVGKGTNVFTLADTVGFGVKSKHPTPIKVPLDKKFCLQSDSNIFGGTKRACTTLDDVQGKDGNTFDILDNGNQEYAVLGQGDYLVPNPNTTPVTYTIQQAKGTTKVNMFKGARVYDGNTLRDAFQVGNTPTKTDGTVEFAAQSANDPNTFNGIVEFQVRVSNVLLGTAGAPVNRKIADFVEYSADDLADIFLARLKGQTSVLGSTTGPLTGGGTPGNTHTSTTRPINIHIGGTPRNEIIDEMSNLNSHRYRYNGNPNIYAINGDLTVNCKAGKDHFEMSGVKTVIVQGNIILNCNTRYKSNDYRASWAWIAQGGNIAINNTKISSSTSKPVTRLEGVYVAIKERVSDSGKFIPVGGQSTSTILRVVGTLYGNADPLFKSRTYVRGNGVYNTLTTGTILTYSNRALVNTPPLLTQYLNHYNLSRVTQ